MLLLNPTATLIGTYLLTIIIKVFISQKVKEITLFADKYRYRPSELEHVLSLRVKKINSKVNRVMRFKIPFIKLFILAGFAFATLFLLDSTFLLAEEYPKYMLLNVHGNEFGITLNSSKVIRGPLKKIKREGSRSEFYFNILTEQGELSYSNNFKLQRKLHYDYFDEIKGSMESALIESDDVDFVVRVPFSSRAKAIKFYKQDSSNEFIMHSIGRLFLDSMENSSRSYESKYNIEKIIDHGRDDNRLVIVIMGDGYTQNQLDDFHEDVHNMVDTLLSTPPWNTYSRYINLYMIDLISNESGADHPSEDIYVDTALDASFGTIDGKGHLLRVNEALAFEVASLVHTFDAVIVIVNDEKFGGSSGVLVTISNYKESGVVVLHEIGHFLADLADEYEGHYSGLPKGDEEANVTFQTGLEYIPWKIWIEPYTPLPTPEDQGWGIGLFEGAKYHPIGIYRPKQTCMMRVIGPPYCEVCREALVLNLYNYVDPIDNYKPSVSTVLFTPTESLNFSIELIDPSSDTLSINWELDGVVLEEGNNATCSLDGSTLEKWTHTLKASVFDKTSMVRNDPYKLLSSSHSWTLVRTTDAGSISGIVKDASNGFPIEGAIVSIGEGAHSNVSEEDGSFNLFEVKEGTYSLTTSADGYLKTYQNNINVIDSDITLVDVYLEPEQMCPATVVLDGDAYFLDLIRKFRDEVLSKTPEGQEIIRLYYEWGPVIVKAMEEDEEFKAEVKEMIDGVLTIIREMVK